MQQDLKWPLTMFVASSINVIGASIAIGVGADKTPDGKKNPFFYMTAISSVIFAFGHAIKIHDTLTKKTFVERMQNSDEDLPEIVIGR